MKNHIGIIPPSEMIINEDGSIFHLHLKPEQVAKNIILVGDRNRVNMVSTFFDTNSIECDICNREFHSITGKYNGKRITCLSHGIGVGNIDIVMTELDALVNVDLNTREEKEEKTSLNIIRIGTSGSLQSFCPLGSYVISTKSIGFDGLLNFYEIPDGIFDLDFEYNLCKHLNWNPRLARPYVVAADDDLVNCLGKDFIKGITISAPGFYGPQGRFVRIKPFDMSINKNIQSFEYNGQKITNYEMESSVVAGMAKILGHKAVTVCDIIAGRVDKSANPNYNNSMENLVKLVLDRIQSL